MSLKENDMPSKKKRGSSINVLIFHHDDLWIAQGLEHDIVAQGSSIDHVEQRFVHTLVAQVLMDLKEGKEPLADLGPAPEGWKNSFSGGRKMTFIKEIDISEYSLTRQNEEEEPLPFQLSSPTTAIPRIKEARVFA